MQNCQLPTRHNIVFSYHGRTNLSSSDIYNSGLFATNSCVALQWARISDTSCQNVLQLTNAQPPSALRQTNKTKDAFYDKLEVMYNRYPRADIKILVGDFNAKVGREGIFGPKSANCHTKHGCLRFQHLIPVPWSQYQKPD